jgi:hypothetical protein
MSLLSQRAEIRNMVGGYLEMAKRAQRKVVESEPLPSSAPCPQCRCAIAWQATIGVLTCADCQPKPSGLVNKMVLVNLDGTAAWTRYPNEIEIDQADEADDATWESADEIIPCSSCGSLMAWWDAKDRRRCMDCDPPTKARQLIRERARIVRQKHLRQKRPK